MGTMSKERTKLDKLLARLALLALIIGVYLAFSGQWIAKDINTWQTKLNGDGKFYPALTAFLIALPPVLLFLVLKKLMSLKNNKQA